MTISKFNYVAPKTIEEAISILQAKGKSATVMAGGTDLLVKIRQKLLNPNLIVGLKKIKNMNLININKKKGLTIGATTLLSTITEHKGILRYYPTIASAARSTANSQVRNMGTLVGNLCNASPSADNAPILLAMKAILNIFGPNGKKTIALEDFFLGPGSTVLNHGELVTSIFVPKPPISHGTAYCSLSQRSTIDCSAIGVGTMITVIKNKFSTVRLFVSACAPTPVRASKTENLLKEQKINDELIYQAASQTSKEMAPISDIRATAKYRMKMIKVVTARALIKAKQMALTKE